MNWREKAWQVKQMVKKFGAIMKKLKKERFETTKIPTVIHLNAKL